ncbi:MAG: TonB-dependent receptor [Bacteroidales bacterium]|nr:TonB-dependent receptor [Bacteroidales bacterium]MCL2133460.1 TonB-dependent receptor [Bacteroidales bacterium]
MKKRIILLSLLLLSFCYVQAARSNTVRIKGVVIDKTTESPLEFGTVSLSDSVGKIIAVNTTNEQGEFTLTAPIGEYSLKISYVGYADVIQPIAITKAEGEINIGEITIEPDAQQLGAVVVSAKKPSVERQIDKLVINIANTIAADNSTALELLKKAPGVVIDRDGNVTLNGQAVEVWVDNRPTQLSGQNLAALLNATEGTTIDKIEIIDNPSSKYDAAGSGGIINIKTKKNFMQGFNGNVRAGYTQYVENTEGYYYGANGSLNLNYRNDAISTFLNYGVQRMEGFADILEDVKFDNGYQRHGENLMKYYYTPHNIKTGIDYFIDKKNTIGLIGSFSFLSGEETSSGTALSQQPQISSESSDNNTSAFRNASLNLNYTRLFGEDGNHDLTANLDYIYYGTNPKQFSHTVYYNPSSDSIFQNNSDQITQVLSAKLDYTRPINQTMKMEVGGKIGFSHNDSEILRNDFLSSGWQINNGLSNAFEYDEMISALYANYSWQIDKQWSAKAGLRWENTYYKGKWKTNNRTTSDNYNDFFPTLFLGYTPQAKHIFSLSYTRRLNRPNYWQINPFKRYVGPYMYVQGNPELSPSYSDNITFSYTAFQVLNIGARFNYNKGMIVQVPEYDDISGHTGYTMGNFGHNQYVGIWVQLSGLPVTKWWYQTLGVYGAYIENDDNTSTTRSTQANLSFNTTLLLDKTWSMEISGWLQTPTIWGYYDMRAQGSVDIGVKKSFCNNQGAVSLYFDDIFKTQRTRLNMALGGMESYLEQVNSTRAIRFSFSWRFGKMSAPTKQRKVGQQEEMERMGSGGK